MSSRPNSGATVAAAESLRTRSGALIVIAVIAVFAALYAARFFFIPVALALLLNLLLSPLVRWLERVRLSAPAATALVMLAGGIVLGGGVSELATPVRVLVANMPDALIRASQRLRSVAEPVQQISNVADQVERAAAGATASPTAGAPKVVVQGASLRSLVYGTTEAVLGGLVETILLLYAMLSVGDLFLEKLVATLPRQGDRERVVRIAHTMESSISTYLLLTALINIGEGAAVAGVMALLKMPTPLLWGALVAAAEFIPYVGMLVMVALIGVASLTTFASLPHALLAPAAFLVITFAQANIVTPLVMSRRLTLNPVAILLSLGFWWWMWGIAGAFLAVPMLAVFKICCDDVPALASIGEFLGDREHDAQLSNTGAHLVRLGMARARH